MSKGEQMNAGLHRSGGCNSQRMVLFLSVFFTVSSIGLFSLSTHARSDVGQSTFDTFL